MVRTPVVSSDIASIGYNPATKVLEVEFVKTGVYSYFNVPAAVYTEFMAADSKGKFFNKAIRQGPYPYEKGEDVDFEGGFNYEILP